MKHGLIIIKGWEIKKPPFVKWHNFLTNQRPAIKKFTSLYSAMRLGFYLYCHHEVWDFHLLNLLNLNIQNV